MTARRVGSAAEAAAFIQATDSVAVGLGPAHPGGFLHALGERDDWGDLQLFGAPRTDLYSALEGRRYDLILSNPPYVTRAAMDTLPAEYLHEPRMALAAGDDGLDLVRRLIAESAAHLNEGGILAVEVGHNRAIVEHAFPELPFNWLGTRGGEDMVFVLRREDLPGGRTSSGA